jgi:hypothetical protein
MSLPAPEFWSFLGYAIPVLGFTLLGRPRRSGWGWDVQDVEDPRLLGVDAPIGTTCRNTLTGDVYVKVGSDSTDWRLFATDALFPVQAGLISSNFDVTPGEINQVNAAQSGTVSGQLPAAASVPNGAWAIVAVNPAAAALTIDILPSSPDTINFGAAALAFHLTNNRMSTTLVSDGVSNWTEVARLIV